MKIPAPRIELGKPGYKTDVLPLTPYGDLICTDDTLPKQTGSNAVTNIIKRVVTTRSRGIQRPCFSSLNLLNMPIQSNY